MVEVSRCPDPPVTVLVPAESSHDASPGPPTPSVQANVVLIGVSLTKTRPEAGAVIVAVGAPTTVNRALVCELEPAWLAAVTVQAYRPGEPAKIELEVAPAIAAPSRVQP